MATEGKPGYEEKKNSISASLFQFMHCFISLLFRRKLSYCHGSCPQPCWYQLWWDPQHPQVSKTRFGSILFGVLTAAQSDCCNKSLLETISVTSGTPTVPNRSAATPLSTRTPTTGWCASSKRKWLASKTCCTRRVWETSSRVSVHAGKRVPQWLRTYMWAHTSQTLEAVQCVFWLCIWGWRQSVGVSHTHSLLSSVPISISLRRPGHHWFEMCVCSNSSKPALCN